MNRSTVTHPPGQFFLAIASFHSEATRAVIDPNQLRQTLESLLGESERQLRSGAVDNDFVNEVKYALVALADELALHSDWDHAEMWRQSLLELRHFNTSFAGAEFFDRIGRLRQRLSTTQDPGLREQLYGVLEIYYTCLRMGFQGRYRGTRDPALQSTADALLALLWPEGEKGLQRGVWAAGYVDGGAGQVVRRGRFWWWPIPLSIAAAVALWFGFSHIQQGRVHALVDQVGQFAGSDGDGR